MPIRYRRPVPQLPVDHLVPVALASGFLPLAFLALFGAAMLRRSSGRPLGSGWAAVLSLTGGLCLGTFLLLAPDPLTAAPMIAIPAVLIASRWRSRRRAQAGWLLLGVAFPWAIVWGAETASPAAAPDPLNVPTWVWLVIGLVPTLIGLGLALRGDPEPLPPNPDAPAGQPGSRSIGSIAAAIREPSLIGPFGQPELAMLVAFIATWLIVPLLIPPSASAVLRIGLVALVAAVVGTEAYVRSMPTRSRRAFEAFSWLGEWELARFRRWSGGGPPTNAAATERWLASHPERPDRSEQAGETSGRVEVLILAGRIDAARSLVARMPQATAFERFDQAAAADLVDWRAGGEGDLAAMERAVTEIEPVNGDERLIAEVAIATARVRRRMADGRSTPGDAAEPFLEVRERLGRRADGQIGRALRRRLIPVMLLSGLVLGMLFEAFGGLALPV